MNVNNELQLTRKFQRSTEIIINDVYKAIEENIMK